MGMGKWGGAIKREAIRVAQTSINKLQWYIVKYSEYSQYFIISVNGNGI